MEDAQIHERIEALEEEQRRLRADESEVADAGRADSLAVDRERLERIAVELDRLWDLLRQRQALRDAGSDPDDAALRDEGTVEGYLG